MVLKFAAAALMAFAASSASALTAKFGETLNVFADDSDATIINFTATTRGPMLGPDGFGNGTSDQGVFGIDDTLQLSGANFDRTDDLVRFRFNSAFRVVLNELGPTVFDEVELFSIDTTADTLASVASDTSFLSGAGAASQILGITEALFDGRIFGAGTYAINFDGGSGNTFYVASIQGTVAPIQGTTAIPLPASALLLMGACGGLAALRRRV